VKFMPEEQAVYVGAQPDMFRPAAGAWGRNGSTLVRLDAVDETTLRGALTAAWRAATAKPARRR